MKTKGNILLVDDTHYILVFLTDILKHEGYTVHTADSGELALHALENLVPDLILLDVKMSGIDGFEVCRRIKSNPKLSLIPIIFLTALTDVNEKIEGIKLGAVDYITKPFHKEELLARVTTHVNYQVILRKYSEQSILVAETNAIKEMNEKLLKAKAIAEENELRFRLMYENTNVGISMVSHDFKILAANNAYCKMLGYSENELIGKSFDFFTHADSLEENLILQEKLGNDLIPAFQMEKKYIHKSGEIIFGLLNATKIKIPNTGGHYFLNNVQDITSKKIAELELLAATRRIEDSEAKFKAIFEHSQDAIGISKDGLNIFFNKAYLKLFGFQSQEELCGKSLLEQIAPSERPKILEYIKKRALNEDIPICYDTIGLKKNGDEFPFEINVGSFYLNSEKYTIAIIRDISERKMYELELKQAKIQAETSEAFLLNIFENIPNMIFIKDAKDLRFTHFNKAGEEFLGISRTEMIGKNDFELFPKEQAEFFVQKDLEVLKSENIVVINQEEINTKTGIKLLSTKKIAIKDQNGNNKYLLGISEDITEKKKIEDELLKAKVRLEDSEFLLIEAQKTAHIGHWNWNIENNLLYWSDEVYNIFGVDKNTFVVSADSFEKAIHPDDLQDFIKTRNESMISNSPMNITHRIVRPGGEIRYVNELSKVIKNKESQITNIFGTVQDITELKLIELELMHAKERAEESDRLKTAFLQNMSHEIRTPLNAICGFSTFLANNDLNEEKRKNFISIIKNSSNQLLAIVTDILTIASLETKLEKANITETNINSIIIELLSIFNQQINNENLRLYSNTELSFNDAIILTDRTKLTQVLTNLLANAIKFTHHGSIEFGYTMSPDLDDKLKPKLLFYVKDTGIGIEPELHQKIFERFRQADLSINRKYGGTGLGLAISKAFIELLGGEIWVESKPDFGSSFYFTIPYNPVHQKEQISKIESSPNNKPLILIAEDDVYNYLYLEESLEDVNCRILHAKNGQQAIDMFKDNPDIKLVLMDIKMPIIDGYTAASIIKKMKPGIPIIAQSAYALAQEKDKYKDQFIEYLTKPIDLDKLKEMILAYLNIKPRRF